MKEIGHIAQKCLFDKSSCERKNKSFEKRKECIKVVKTLCFQRK